jgi:hypothetical protein
LLRHEAKEATTSVEVVVGAVVEVVVEVAVKAGAVVEVVVEVAVEAGAVVEVIVVAWAGIQKEGKMVKMLHLLATIILPRPCRSSMMG